MLGHFGSKHVLIWSLLCVLRPRMTDAETCRVNPECSCSNREGSYVSCTRKYRPYFPVFVASEFNITRISVYGSRKIREIGRGSFQGVSAKELAVHNTGITDIRCYQWGGLSGLTKLDLSRNELTSIPRCRLEMLETLTLKGNNITTIESEGFKNFSKLERLTLSGNQISAISPGAFEGLTKVSFLDISSNNLTVIGSNAFSGLTSLSNLHLWGNRIATLHARAFDGLLNLGILNIGRNKLSTMDSTTFLPLKKLIQLTMDDNSMFEIPGDLLKSLKRLRTLRINRNSLVALTENVFKENQDLLYLDLSNNRLASIHPDTFITTPKLRHLFLSYNSLTHIQSAWCGSLRNLYRLDMNSNKLTVLQRRLFVNCHNLRYIYLQGNTIYRLHAEAFENATSLSTVDIRNNQLENLPDDMLLRSAKLQVLLLGANKINFIANATILRHRNTIRTLDLSDNGLTSASWSWLEEIIRGLPNTTTVNLTYNNFPYAAPDIVGRLWASYRGVMLSHNKLQRIEMDAQYYDTLHRCYVFFGPTNYRCGNFNFAKNKLSDPVLVRTARPVLGIFSVDLSFNIITKMEQFPVQVVPPQAVLGCPTFVVQRLNLSHNAISTISAKACLGSVHVLDLRDNRIEVLGPLVPEEHNSSFYQLREIYLSGNRIHRISYDAFIFFTGSIRTIDLAYNNLTEVNSIRVVSTQGTFSRQQIQQRYTLRLLGNPIHCDGETDWLRNGTSAPNLDSVRCHTPQTVNGFLVVCFKPLGCKSYVRQTNRDKDLCKKDINVRISNVTASVLTSADLPRLNVTWSRTGPGIIKAFRMTTYSSSEQTGPPRLIVAEERNAVILYPADEPDISICISAVVDSGVVTEESCTNVSQEITSSGEDFRVSKGLFIGLVSSLAVIVVILTGVITVGLYWIRRCRSDRGGERKEPPSSATENVNMYNSAADYENTDNEKCHYETVD